MDTIQVSLRELCRWLREPISFLKTEVSLAFLLCWNLKTVLENADNWEAAITSATVGAAFIFSFVGGFVTDR